MTTSCSVEWCDRDVQIPSRGMCRRCYQRERSAEQECSVDGCTDAVSGRGWCVRHYQRWRHYGDPLPTRMWMSADVVHERRDAFFWANVEQRGPDECWPWLRKPTPNGYGQLRGYTGATTAHRFSYELHHGEVPPGLQVDHTCHERSCEARTACPHRLCVNPAHLEATSGRLNRLRGITARPGNGGATR